MESEEQKSPSILTRTWRYIPFKKYDPVLSVALSDVALNSANKTGSPIVWIYGVEKNTVSVGIRQKISDVVDAPQAKKLNIQLVRRLTNGGALYLDTAGELSWAVAVSNELIPADEAEIIKYFVDKIADGLLTLGIESYLKVPNDIMTTLGKISAVSIKQERYATLIQGTLLFAVNTAMMESVLTPENNMAKKRRVPERMKPITSVSMEAEKNKEETIHAISEGLLNGLTFKVDDWAETELTEAKLLEDKYQSIEWLYPLNLR